MFFAAGEESRACVGWISAIMASLLLSACAAPSPAATTTPSHLPNATTPTGTALPTSSCPEGAHPLEGQPWSCIYDRPPAPTSRSTPRLAATPEVPQFTARQAAEIAHAGTPIPSPAGAVDSRSFPDLEIVAEWGRGSILGVAFVPGSPQFIAASPFGFAVYASHSSTAPPLWVDFDRPFVFESLFLSEDAKYVLLEGENEDQVRAFPSGEIASPPQDVEWLRTSTMRESWGTIKATSPDGSLRLESHNELSEEWFEIEYSIREIYDRASGNLKYTLKDQTIQISYDDRTSPEGCDLPVFAIDGNALAPAAAHPYRAAFSPSGGVLGILYRAPNLWDSKWFSTLRLYDSTDGKILRLIGSLQRPVETFAFSPDTEEVVVAYIDGGIEVWDPYEASPELAATHFTSDIVNMAYTSSGDFVLVQRFGTVEIRRSADGAMRSRHDATAFAISPAGDQVAIGTQHGVVQVFDVPSGETIQRIDAHSAEVYALAFTPDGKTLASSGEDCRVLAWDVHSGRLKHLYQENATDPYELGEKSRVFIYKLDFIPGTSRLIGFGSWGRVVGWDANTGETKYFFEPEPLEFYHGMMTAKPHFPEDMRIAPEEGLFYIGGAAYDLDSGENVAQANMRAIPPSGCFEVGPSVENGRFLVTIGYEEREGQLCLVNASDLSLPATIRILDAERPEDVIVLWPVASPDRHRLLLPLTYGSIYVAQVSYPRTP